MGWITIGLLIVSGGCVLYRHPPTALVHLLARYRRALSKGIPRQPKPIEDETLSTDGKDQGLCEELHSSHVPAVIVEDATQRNQSNPLSIIGPPRLTTVDTSDHSLLQPPTLSPKSPPRRTLPTFGSMPPPPRPSNNAPLRPPPSAASSLRVPPTKTLSNAAFAPSRLTAAPAKPSRQVTLTAGHSPLDWAALTSNPNNRLRGKDAPQDKLIRVPPSRLKYQNGRKGRDAWTVYQGKVYNITPYLPFHPGGEGELMRGAGRDAAKLFMEVHPWVNWEAMLGECMVGILVGEGEGQMEQKHGAGELDEMD